MLRRNFENTSLEEGFSTICAPHFLRAALELHEAFQDTGFAIVVNHGIQKETSDILRAHSLKYFSLNIDKKSLLADGKSIKVSTVIPPFWRFFGPSKTSPNLKLTKSRLYMINI